MTPTVSFDLGLNKSYFHSGLSIAASNRQELDIVDLSGATPTLTRYGPSGLQTFSASSATQWVAGDGSGAIFDGASASTTPRYFGYGAPHSIAASPNLVAVSTSTGKILLLDPSGTAAQASIDFWAGQVALSSDGTVLGADRLNETSSVHEINFYALPSQKLIGTFPFPSVYPGMPAWAMSASGNAVGIIDGSTRYVSDLNGKVSWSDSGITAPIYLSPDGTLVAAPSGVIDQSCSLPTTSIYKNGVTVTTVSAYGEGWIDNEHLLASNWTPPSRCPATNVNNIGLTIPDYVYIPIPNYIGSTIYSSTGAIVISIPATAALPPYPNPQFPTTDTVFLGPNGGGPIYGFYASNELYSLPSGAAIWKVPTEVSGPCAVSGSYAVCQVGHQLLLYPH